MKFYRKHNLERFILDLSENSQEKSAYHPVDRAFLEPYIPQILSYDLKDFVYYNIEMTSDLYATQLFLCLPEVWEEMGVDDILELCCKLSEPIFFYTVIKFTYKYLEIDMLEQILSDVLKNRPPEYLAYILAVLKDQYSVLIKSEYEIEDYCSDPNWGVDLDRWLYIKQRMLLDKRVKPALLDVTELKKYLDSLIAKYA